MSNLRESKRKLRGIKRLFRRTYSWLTATRRRKILSSILAVLILLTSIRFAFFNQPKKVLAAKMELTETSDSITIDVPNRYRAVMQKGDTNDYLLFYDRAQNDSNPDQVMEARSASVADENVSYYLEFDASRTTTILESSDIRVRLRVEGCLDTAAGGNCIKDVAGGNNDKLAVIEEWTFTTEGVFKHVVTDFKDGIELDGVDYWDNAMAFSVLKFNQGASNTHSDTILYGDGETEGTSNTTGNLGISDHYIVLQGVSTYQDIVTGEMEKNGNKFLSNSNNADIYYSQSTSDYFEFKDESTQTLIGKGNAQFFVQFQPQSELDSEEEREGVFNDIVNPDTLDFTTGDLWDDKPLTSAGTATSSAVLFHSGYEGGDSDLCDGGDGWTGGDCESGNTAVGDESITVYDDSYSAKFTSTGTNDMAQVYKDGFDHQTLHVRIHFRLDYEDLADVNTLSIIIFRDITNAQSNTIRIKQVSGNLELSYGDTVSSANMGSDSEIQLDTWYSLEARVYRHPTLGTIDAWLNGVSVLNATGLDTGDGNTERLRFGIISSTTNNNQLYLDNIIVSESYIGTAHYNEAEGTYTADASSNQVEFDIDAGGNVSTLVNDGTHISSGETPITVDSTTGFPSAGVAYIEGDKFSYTSTSGTTFIGVPATGELAINYHADNSVVSLPKRHSPSVKMRGYRDNTLPDEAVLEGERLQRDYDYIADIKPFSNAVFADELYMHYALEDLTAGVGDTSLTNGGGSFVTGKYGQGFEFNVDGDDLNVTVSEGPTNDYEQEAGMVELWYQPYYDHNDSATHYLFNIYIDDNNEIHLRKDPTNNLKWKIDDGGTEIKMEIDNLDYSWDAYDWVHIRATWDASEPVATQLRLYINGVEPTHADDPESDDFDGVFASAPNTLVIGNDTAAATEEANGIIDEFKLYNTSSAISELAQGGNTADSNEYLADSGDDYALDFEADDADNRGEYMYLGSDSAFSGVNVDLETDGVGSSENFVWEYWDGTGWTTLTVTEQETGASEWLADGNFYFIPPPDWVPYSVNGSTDLYYIRGHLEGGSYTTTPVENKVLTDIVTFQYTRYGGNISAENMTFEIPGWTSNAPPVAYWKFDEGYGTTAYSTSSWSEAIGSPELTIKDATWEEESLCISGKCLHFDGSEDQASRSAQLTQLDFKETNSFTLTGWFKHASSVTGTDTIISKYESTGSDGGYKVYMDSSGYVCAGVDDDNTWGPDDPACTTTSYADSRWHHFSAVRHSELGSESLELYIDGNRVAYDDNIAASSTLENNDGFYIGADEGGYQNYWDGFIDEVKVYRYARNADEIKVDYTGGAAVFGDKTDWLSDGLVGYWKMDESALNGCSGGEDSCDSSGNSHHGTWEVSMDTTDIVTGQYGNGVDLDGTDDYLSVSSTDTLNITGPITIALWIKTAGAQGGGDYRGIIDKGSSQSYSLLTGSGSGRDLSFYLKNNEVIETGEILSDNVWQHVVVTWDGSQAYMFLDGDIIDTGTYTGSVISNSTDVGIGGYGFNGCCTFDGLMDEVRIYNRALSPAEVQKLYKWAPGAIAHYKLDESTGTTAYDSSGEGNNGSFCQHMDGDEWEHGKYGSSLYFYGTFDTNRECVDFDSAGFESDFNQARGSMMAWIKVSDVGVWTDGTRRIAVTVRDDADNKVDIVKHSTDDNSLYFNYEDGAASSEAQLNNTSRTDWIHAAITWNVNYDGTNDEIKYYIDGVLIETDTLAAHDGVFALTPDDNVIGSRNTSGTEPWHGWVDDVRIYDYPRTSEQIISDMNAGHPAPGAAAWTNNGKFGKAWDGNGTVTINNGGDDADFDFSETDDFTISGWFQHDTISTNPDYIFVKAQAGTNAGYKIYMASDGDIVFEFDDDATWDPDDQLTSTAATYDDNSWHHFTAVKDDTTAAYLYIDGVLIEKDVSIASTATLANDDTLYVGVDDDGSSNPFDGQLDELKVFRFALSADQMNMLYNQGKSAVFGATSTDSSGVGTWSSLNEYCPPGQGSSCTAPVGEWKFDEKNGTDANDTSENSYTGTLGGGTADYRPTWSHAGECKKGGCLKFDGSNDHINIGDNVDLSGNQAMTLEAWIYPRSLPGVNSRAVSKYDTGTTGEWYLGIDSNGLVNFLRECGSYGTNSTSTITTNEWQHIVGTYDATDLKIYINGRLDKETTDSCSISNTTAETVAGAEDDGSGSTSNFNGLIDEVKIYNYARSQAQIAWEYNRGAPVGWWKFDECQGNTAYDSSGNGNNGTITAGDTSGSNDSAGTCSSGAGDEMWDNGTNGKRNASLDFDGTDDYVDVGDVLDFEKDDPISVEAWIKTSYTADPQAIVSKTTGSGGANWTGWQFSLGWGNNGRVALILANNWTDNSISRYSTNIVNDGNWHHVAATYDGSEDATGITLYVDGVVETPVTYTNSLTATTVTSAPLNIGTRNLGAIWDFNGQIDDVQIFNYELTPLQINTLYNEGSVHFGP